MTKTIRSKSGIFAIFALRQDALAQWRGWDSWTRCVEIRRGGQRALAASGTEEPEGIQQVSIPNDGGTHHLVLGAQGHPVANLLVDERHGLVVAFKGEIYNATHVAGLLKKAGFEPLSMQAPAIIACARRAWGDDFLAELNGRWSLAIWDKQQQILVCARDRMGIENLYYHQDGAVLMLASHPAWFVDCGLVKAAVREDAARRFLEKRVVMNGDQTFFQGIRCLKPGCSLVVQQGEILETRYWHPLIAAGVEPPPTLEACAGRFREIYQDALAMRLPKDQSVGFSLSGGLDSSTNVCTANRYHISGEKIRTFSITFDEEEVSERNHSELVIRAVGARSVYLQPDGESLEHCVHHLVPSHGHPFVWPTPYPQWLLFQEAARQGIQVVVDGAGPDHYLAGSRLAEQVATKGTDASGGRTDGFLTPLQGFLLSQTLAALPYVVHTGRINAEDAGIQVRYPYMDHRLVEFAFSLPDRMKFHDGWRKVLLREATRGILPEEIRTRRDKVGFAMPDWIWLNQPWIREVLLSEELANRPFVNADDLRLLARRFYAGASLSWQERSTLWRHLFMEVWCRAFTSQGSHA